VTIDADAFQRLLQGRRAELEAEERASEEARAPVTLDQESVGRLSRIDAMQVQAMALAHSRRRQQELAAIEAALRRIEEGEYGWCLTCGEAIAEPRLRLNPTVAACIACARGE
jgi:DnaK suppressor protein